MLLSFVLCFSFSPFSSLISIVCFDCIFPSFSQNEIFRKSSHEKYFHIRILHVLLHKKKVVFSSLSSSRPFFLCLAMDKLAQHHDQNGTKTTHRKTKRNKKRAQNLAITERNEDVDGNTEGAQQQQ